MRDLRLSCWGRADDELHNLKSLCLDWTKLVLLHTLTVCPRVARGQTVGSLCTELKVRGVCQRRLGCHNSDQIAKMCFGPLTSRFLSRSEIQTPVAVTFRHVSKPLGIRPLIAIITSIINKLMICTG
jgi:hypothetical protein